MLQSQSYSHMDGTGFQVISRWGTALLCFLQMWYVALESYRHWRVMGPSSHVLLVPYLMLYSLPWLRLMRGNDSPFVTILVYVILGTASFLIFPLAP